MSRWFKKSITTTKLIFILVDAIKYVITGIYNAHSPSSKTSKSGFWARHKLSSHVSFHSHKIKFSQYDSMLQQRTLKKGGTPCIHIPLLQVSYPSQKFIKIRVRGASALDSIMFKRCSCVGIGISVTWVDIITRWGRSGRFTDIRVMSRF